MKKPIYFLLAVSMLFALAACGGKAVESEIKEWTRQGTFEDENGNQLFVNLSETEGYEGWAVSFILDGEPIGWIIQQEGNALRGNLNGWDETLDPFMVTVTEEGEDGLKLEVEGAETYHFTPMDVPEAAIVVTVNTDGWGYISYAEGEKTPEIDPEYPAQSAYIGLAEPAVHTFTAWPKAGNVFVKWTKNGEDFSTEPQITLLLDESADYAAVFEESPDWQNPVMNFVGEYRCEGAHAAVECLGFDEAWISIRRSGSDRETIQWDIVGSLEPDTLTIKYSHCRKSIIVCDDSGEVTSQEWEYEDGTGTIVFSSDGTFTWHEDQSETGDELVFHWVGTGEDPDCSDYLGRQYTGEDPWGNPLSVTLKSMEEDVLTFAYSVVISEGEYVRTFLAEAAGELIDGVIPFHITATAKESEAGHLDYSGSLTLRDGSLFVTYDDGSVVEDSPEGGSAGYQAPALEEGDKTVELTAR